MTWRGIGKGLLIVAGASFIVVPLVLAGVALNEQGKNGLAIVGSIVAWFAVELGLGAAVGIVRDKFPLISSILAKLMTIIISMAMLATAAVLAIFTIFAFGQGHLVFALFPLTLCVGIFAFLIHLGQKYMVNPSKRSQDAQRLKSGQIGIPANWISE